MPFLGHLLQVLLDEERYRRLERRAAEQGVQLQPRSAPPASATVRLIVNMQRGPVDELLDVAVEGPALDQLDESRHGLDSVARYRAYGPDIGTTVRTVRFVKRVPDLDTRRTT